MSQSVYELRVMSVCTPLQVRNQTLDNVYDPKYIIKYILLLLHMIILLLVSSLFSHNGNITSR